MIAQRSGVKVHAIHRRLHIYQSYSEHSHYLRCLADRTASPNKSIQHLLLIISMRSD